MSKFIDKKLEIASKCWSAGKALDAGVAAFDGVDAVNQAIKCGAIVHKLGDCFGKDTRIAVCTLTSLLTTETLRSRVRAKGVFETLRAQTLKLERIRRPSREQEQQLHLQYIAENFAKVVSNCAVIDDDGFDEDSAAWLVRCVHDYLTFMGNDMSFRDLWNCGQENGTGAVSEKLR